MTRRPRLLPLWVLLGTEGVLTTLLSGRRKALIVVFVFLLCFTLLSRGWHRQRLLICLVIACVIAIPLLGLLADERYVETAETSLPNVGTRVTGNLYEHPLYLLTRVGPFGYGAGMRSQGSQHVKSMDVELPYSEGGIEKILVEIGVLGFLALVSVAAVVVRYIYRSMRWVRRTRLLQSGPALLLALTVANASAFVVSGQLYGDPFVIVSVGFVVGLLLSGLRLSDRAARLAAATRRRASRMVLPLQRAPASL